MAGRLAVMTATLVMGLFALPAAAPAMFVAVKDVRQTSAATSAAKTVTVACPAGKRVMSGGFEVSPPDGRVLVNYVRPSASLSSVTVSASEDEAGTEASWTLTAYAICAPAPAGLQLVKATSAASSVSKVAYAVCPTGKRVLGTGGEVTGAAGQLLLRGLTPSSELDKVTASAFEDETGTTASWTVTAYAICGSPAQRPVRRNRVSAYASGSPRYITSPCEPGEAAVGIGGATIGGAGNQLVLQSIEPDLYSRYASVAAAEDRTGYAGTWTPEAYTICAAELFDTWGRTTSTGNPSFFGAGCGTGQLLAGTGAVTEFGRGEVWLGRFGPQDVSTQHSSVGWNTETARQAEITTQAYCATASALPGYERYITSDPVERPDSPVKTAIAPCPVGKRVLSAGNEFSGDESHLVTQTLIPSADLASVRVDVAETEAGAPEDWQMWATALCATPPPGLQRIAKTTVADSREYKIATATCPAGKHVVGSGALISPQVGEVLLDDIDANDEDAMTTVTVEAFEDRDGFDRSWSLTAYAVCVTR